jgi:formimidoylglutamate deiminase
VVLCPSTEANLGDGLADLPRWLAAGVPLTLGSDSNVCRHWAEELRWLDYGQRLLLRQRNVAAAPALHEGATAARLFERVLSAGAAAAGLPAWGLVTGARADLLVLDLQAPGLLGMPASHTLDALVFATDAPALREVWVAGRRVVAGGRPIGVAAATGRSAAEVAAEVAADFAGTMAELWPA